MSKFPFEEKSIDELLEEANNQPKRTKEMTEEEEMEDDADGGYFEED